MGCMKFLHRKQIKFLTYNVWSREDVAVYTRMKAIGRLVEKHKPDVIFFQEITPYILKIFQSFAWWKNYHSSPVTPEEQKTEHHFCLILSKILMENYERRRFIDTATGRGYMEADINPWPAKAPPIHIATTQLERPGRAAAQTRSRSMERYLQAEHAVAALGSARNVVLGGDMAWDDGADLPFPLPPSTDAAGRWVDAWTALRPHDRNRCTYDGIWNEDLAVFNGYAAGPRSLEKRSDRFVCKLEDYKLRRIELIGEEAIGIEYLKRGEGQQDDVLQLKPSCHLGMVLTVVPKR